VGYIGVVECGAQQYFENVCIRVEIGKIMKARTLKIASGMHFMYAGRILSQSMGPKINGGGRS